MNKKVTNVLFGILLFFLTGTIIYWIQHRAGADHQKELTVGQKKKQTLAKLSKQDDEEGVENEEEEQKGRQQYFFRLLRNPATNAIPKNIRSREVKHARSLPTRQLLNRRLKSAKASGSVPKGFQWRLAGPPAIGGRTRALGIDQRDASTIIAGAVSGGIWKSTDGGSNWTLRTPSAQNFSVTSLDQDPTQPNTWYYAAGEYNGNSAASIFNGRQFASYTGRGIYKSTDNGDTWKRIPSTKDNTPQFDSQFAYVSRLRVNPTTGTVFIAANAVGIYRSPNGRNFSDLTLGAVNKYTYSDVAVASNGTVAAVLSDAAPSSQTGSNNPGVFMSNDDGQSWTKVTPSSFPPNARRSVLAFAPSNPNILYVFTLKGSDNSSNQGVSFYKLDLSANPQNAQDRAANLPDFGGQVGGINTQNGYNMTVKVKPDDPDFVMVGGTDLFRSTDGFATGPTGDSQAQKNKFWIGGYAKANDVSNYPNQHADQHIQFFDPNNPNKMWAGHDGGLSLTTNVTANSVSWQDKNKGYIVTQFYDASIGPDSNSTSLAGGSQDNGTPFFTFGQNQSIGSASNDLSTGDGGLSFFTKNYIYASNATSGTNNRIERFSKDFSTLSYVHPSQAQPPLFVDPYIIDPNDEGIMYYADANKIYRNINVDKISNDDNPQGTTQGWEIINNASLSGYNISAFAVTTNPRNILYYAGSNSSNRPVIKRLKNASKSNQTPTDISIPASAVPNKNISGAFLHDIAVNPGNGNELLAVMTNYDIVGVYHSQDGGTSWQAVEGNLTGVNDDQSPDQGPSIRSATIIPAKAGPIYLLGTSTGVYSTRTLSGQDTQWVRESAADNDGIADIGFSVVEDITSRFSNGDVAVGSHGRGMFIGRFQGSIANIKNQPSISINPTKGQGGNPTENKNGKKVTLTAQNFQFTKTDSVFFDRIPADIITTSFPTNQLMVYVPRIPIPQNAKLTNGNYNVTVKVKRKGQNLTTNFTLLSPQTNGLSQNYPNPFQHTTSIPVDVAQKGRVRLSIYNTSGQQVYQSKDQVYTAGTHNIPVDFSGKASGIYVYRVMIKPTGSGDTFTDSKKFTFIK